MVPTLQDGDRLLVLNSLWDDDYQYGDIVVLRKDTFMEEPIVKRVIATEGQTVDIDFAAGSVYVDGELLEEDYINEPTYVEEGTEFPLTVPEGSIFVMGDNRNHSSDSRSSDLGTVDTRYVIGQAVFLLFPGAGRGARRTSGISGRHRPDGRGGTHEHSMVSRSHDQNPADDRRADQKRGRGVRDRGRPDPRLQPEPGRGRADGGQAPAGGAEPGGPGGPGGHEALGGLVPRQGLRGAGVRRQERRRHQAVRRRCPDAAGGQAPRLRGKGQAEPGGPGDDPGGAQRGQVHLHQPASPAARPPRPRTGPASPGPSSGCPSTRGWSCWTPPASSGPSSRTRAWG